MEKRHFPNPKLLLPKAIKNTQDQHLRKTFAGAEQYLDMIGDFIYTDINLDFEKDDPAQRHAWVLRVVSATLLRSLYLRNSFVEAFNSRNMVGVYLPLKAWFETVGFLAGILELLERDLSPEEFKEAFLPYAMGNRGKGKLRVGTVDAISAQTLIEKADKYLKKISQANPEVLDTQASKFFTDFYDVVSNPTHPSYDAHEIVEVLEDNGMWRGKTPDEVKALIEEDLPGYGALLMSPRMIKSICEKIFAKEKEEFAKLGAKKYFSKEESRGSGSDPAK